MQSPNKTYSCLLIAQNVIDVYVENAKGYIENYENNARGISRSIFERQLIEALLKSKLKLEPNLSLIYAVSSVLHIHDQDRPVVGFQYILPWALWV